MTPEQLAAQIDHTLLSPIATGDQYRELFSEAIQYGFHSVCVPSSRIDIAVTALEETSVRVCSVVGFPFGYADADAKRYETEVAVDLGAHEIDVVLNLGMVKERADELIFRELRDVVEAADERPVKVILETGYLDREEIVRLVELFKKTGAHFVKTSTGFGPRGASVEDVQLLRELVGPGYGVKASGGIRDFETAAAMIEAGADRLGTSSGVTLVEECRDTDSGIVAANE